ncbi:SMI1/KNR4 family protein [Pseudomonas monteilii]|uniref:SMI1/KNR4 family protein n=1 Tax=Pseudomonas monteilii TaxID=76759 RepID=UPI00383BE514
MVVHGEWYQVPGASRAALASLSAIAPRELPDEYYQLLSHSNGGEGPLPVEPKYFVLYPAEEAANPEQLSLYQQMAPRMFVIGGNGGGEIFAFDLRNDSAPWPVVCFDPIDPEGSVLLIAESFKAFVALVGRE